MRINCNKWLANTAHELGAAMGLKNDLGQVGDLVDIFDFHIDEQCKQYDECQALLPFLDANKAIFQVEYHGTPERVCADLNTTEGSPLFSVKVAQDGLYVDCCNVSVRRPHDHVGNFN